MIIGIGGISRSGKTSLAKNIRKHFEDRSCSLVHQDNYVFPEDQIPKIKDHLDWECPDSIDFECLIQNVEKINPIVDVIIVEGLLAFYNPTLNELYDKRIFLHLDKQTFLERKEKDLRWGKEPDWYMEHIWESYLKYGHLPTSDEDALHLRSVSETSIEALWKYLNAD